MGLSLEECERLGIAGMHPDHADNRKAAPKRRAAPKLNERGQNKTEASFDAYLADLKWWGRIADFRFEPFKLRLAGRTYYSPDFAVRRNGGTLCVVEVKGFMRDDAAVKTKTAAEQFGWLGSFYLVRRDRSCADGWDVRPVTRSGIGGVPVGPLWMEAR